LGPPHIINLLTKMWRIIINSIILFHNILEYVKLIDITMIHVLFSMEDEWIFNNLNFIKSQIHNWLIKHSTLCIHMFG
jgi:hypothetical protein